MAESIGLLKKQIFHSISRRFNSESRYAVVVRIIFPAKLSGKQLSSPAVMRFLVNANSQGVDAVSKKSEGNVEGKSKHTHTDPYK